MEHPTLEGSNVVLEHSSTLQTLAISAAGRTSKEGDKVHGLLLGASSSAGAASMDTIVTTRDGFLMRAHHTGCLRIKTQRIQEV